MYIGAALLLFMIGSSLTPSLDDFEIPGSKVSKQMGVEPSLTLVRDGNCPMTLAHLGSKLPRYNDSDLNLLRNTILKTNMMDVMREARRQGFSPQAAARATLEQAREFRKSQDSAEECIRAAAAGNPARIISSLQNGTYDLGRGVGITTSCAKAYVLFYYGLVSNEEMAIAMACLATEMR